MQPQQQALSFLFFGDTQPNPSEIDYTSVGKLISEAAAIADKPGLIILGGDTVDDGGDEAQWREFRYAAGAALEGSIVAAVPGNHDNYHLLALQFDYPDAAPEMPGEGFFYTFQVESVFFIMLDSNIMGAANQRDINWLENELKSETAQQADWRVAVMHHPMWTITDTPRDTQRALTMSENFLPLLETHGVSLILCGHQHVYARTVPMSGGAIAPDGEGIVQIMAASGDKASYSAGERDFIAASAEAPNYLLLTADSESIIITAFDGEHNVIDQFTILKKV